MSRYIDADALVEVLEGWQRDCAECDYESETGQVIFDVICQIQDQPTADVVEVGHGEWVPTRMKNHACSLCHDKYHFTYPYCPSCGAKMDGERSTDNE